MHFNRIRESLLPMANAQLPKQTYLETQEDILEYLQSEIDKFSFGRSNLAQLKNNIVKVVEDVFSKFNEVGKKITFPDVLGDKVEAKLLQEGQAQFKFFDSVSNSLKYNLVVNRRDDELPAKGVHLIPSTPANKNGSKAVEKTLEFLLGLHNAGSDGASAKRTPGASEAKNKRFHLPEHLAVYSLDSDSDHVRGQKLAEDYKELVLGNKKDDLENETISFLSECFGLFDKTGVFSFEINNQYRVSFHVNSVRNEICVSLFDGESKKYYDLKARMGDDYDIDFDWDGFYNQ